MRTLISIAKRELQIRWVERSEWFSVIIFFFCCNMLFPMASGGFEQENLVLAPVIIWISAITATLFAQESLLKEDFKLGIFEFYLLHKAPFEILLMAKVITNWIVYAIPIILLTPLVAIAFGLNGLSIAVISSGLFIGSLYFSLMSAIGAAITIPLAKGGGLLALLLIPLYIPMLCLGSAIGILSIDGVVSYAHFALMIAITVGALVLVPFITAIAVKVNME